MALPLDRATRKHLTACVQYLNLDEMRAHCHAHGLPLVIHVAREDGSLRSTGDRDRKDVVLRRILDHALEGRRAGPTVYAAAVVCADPLPPTLTGRTRIHYNQYEKKNPRFVAKMVELTGGDFRTGMIARLVLRDFWTAGVAPTMRQFATAWSKATAEHQRPRPEGAYLVDRWKGEAGADWKEVRRAKAREALDLLARAERERTGAG